MFGSATINNPKRDLSSKIGSASWYPYYAGFSADFVLNLCKSLKLEPDTTILDPWNGSGTTTIAAASLHLNSIGFDLNPVMVIAAKARALSLRTKQSLNSLTKSILDKTAFVNQLLENDPLNVWVTPSSTKHIRQIERSIQAVLIDSQRPIDLTQPENINELSDLAAFFYIALFRTTRLLLERYIGSNPTWIKKPNTPHCRVRPRLDTIHSLFISTVSQMIGAIDDNNFIGTKNNTGLKISVASSKAIPLPDSSIDFVLSSPPYCTRIDYAVATSSELAILGFRQEKNSQYEKLRRSLLGTSTVSKGIPNLHQAWGETCLDFLNKVKNHGSKASQSYYYKNHIQYFAGIFDSIQELKRVMKTNGGCVLVVQDSHYKEIHNDVPKIIIEMATNNGFQLLRDDAFEIQKNMARLNPRVKKYRTHPISIERVLCLGS